jgi:diacylglycerol O-acyltransferase
LSPVDAAFLYLERKEIPLHIASVSVFDGAIPFKEFVASIRTKLHLVPRYRQIAVTPPWNLSLPTWQDAPHFDIHQHIFRETLDPPGGEKELEALAGRIFSGVLDRSKPLWDIHVVDGLKDGRGAIIWRMHHALADGISGTEILKVMLDVTPKGSAASRKPRYRLPHTPAPDRSKDSIFGTVRSSLEGLLALENGLLSFGESLLDDEKRNELKGLFELLPELAASVERLPFNKPCTGERKFCWAEFNFEDLQAVREAAGGTVNDIVLAVLTRALARYVKLHGQSVVNRFVRIVCPVSLRQGDHSKGLGNQISFLPVALPMDVRNPVRMLEKVRTRTEKMKRSGAANLVGLIASWIAAAPAPLQALLWGGLPDIIFPVPLLNMICTNVSGSPVPLYAVGRRMLASYPQVPIGYDLGVGVAVQSYDGKLFMGLLADAQSAPDVDQLRDFIIDAFQELCQSASVKKARDLKRAAHRMGARALKAAKAARAPAIRPVKETPTAATAKLVPLHVDAA